MESLKGRVRRVQTSKISREIALQIREERLQGSLWKDLMKKYDISPGTLQKIILGTHVSIRDGGRARPTGAEDGRNRQMMAERGRERPKEAERRPTGLTDGTYRRDLPTGASVGNQKGE